MNIVNRINSYKKQCTYTSILFFPSIASLALKLLFQYLQSYCTSKLLIHSGELCTAVLADNATRYHTCSEHLFYRHCSCGFQGRKANTFIERESATQNIGSLPNPAPNHCFLGELTRLSACDPVAAKTNRGKSVAITA